MTPGEVGARRRADILRDHLRYVYKRHGEPCRRCGTTVIVGEMAVPFDLELPEMPALGSTV